MRLSEMEAQYARNRLTGDTTKIAEQIRRLRRELAVLKREIYSHLDPWQVVQVSRHQERPQTRDYIELLFEQFIELHGDRAIGDDQAIVTGLAHLDEYKIMFVGQYATSCYPPSIATSCYTPGCDAKFYPNVGTRYDLFICVPSDTGEISCPAPSRSPPDRTLSIAMFAVSP